VSYRFEPLDGSIAIGAAGFFFYGNFKHDAPQTL
jgi:hypothetical protein